MFSLDKYSNNKRERDFQFLKIRFLILFLLILIGFSSYHFFKTKLKQNKISKEVVELQNQIDKFEKKNKNLEQLSGYLQTDDFKEREAKQKLNLVKEGEKVVIVKKEEIEKIVQQENFLEPEVAIDRPNYYYWWHYFFGINKAETSSINTYEQE